MSATRTYIREPIDGPSAAALLAAGPNLGAQMWNQQLVLGILDFVVAFTTATICAMTIANDTPPTIAPMGQLPLVLIPAYLVPLFIMLHLAALFQARRQASTEQSGGTA